MRIFMTTDDYLRVSPNSVKEIEQTMQGMVGRADKEENFSTVHTQNTKQAA